jgi:thioesterase domain-containing protein
MKAAAFLAELRSRDIEVWLDGGRLRCKAPAALLTPNLRDELQRRKDELLAFLRSADALARQQRAIVPLQPHGSRPPVFAVPGHNGDVFCYRALARHLGEDQPFFGLQPPGLDGHGEPLASIEALAAHFRAQIHEFRRQGPYLIAGYCAGGLTAFALARQLVQEGSPVLSLALFGAPYAARFRRLAMLRERCANHLARGVKHGRGLAAVPLAGWPAYLAGELRERGARLSEEKSNAADPVLALRSQVERATLAAARRYTPERFAGRVCLFLPSRAFVQSYDQPLRWRSVAPDAEEYYGPDGCERDQMLREPYVSGFAGLFMQSVGKQPLP